MRLMHGSFPRKRTSAVLAGSSSPFVSLLTQRLSVSQDNSGNRRRSAGVPRFESPLGRITTSRRQPGRERAMPSVFRHRWRLSGGVPCRRVGARRSRAQQPSLSRQCPGTTAIPVRRSPGRRSSRPARPTGGPAPGCPSVSRRRSTRGSPSRRSASGAEPRVERCSRASAPTARRRSTRRRTTPRPRSRRGWSSSWWYASSPRGRCGVLRGGRVRRRRRRRSRCDHQTELVVPLDRGGPHRVDQTNITAIRGLEVLRSPEPSTLRGRHGRCLLMKPTPLRTGVAVRKRRRRS